MRVFLKGFRDGCVVAALLCCVLDQFALAFVSTVAALLLTFALVEQNG